MCVVFLTWEGTLYVTLTVSASTRKNHHIEFAECEQSILQSRPYLCSPAKVPNDLDCSVGLWTQQFRQGHHSAQTHRLSKNAPPLQRSTSPTLQHSNTPILQRSDAQTLQKGSTSQTLQRFQNAPTLQCSNVAQKLQKRSTSPTLQRSNAPTFQHSNALKMLHRSLG